MTNEEVIRRIDEIIKELKTLKNALKCDNNTPFKTHFKSNNDKTDKDNQPVNWDNAKTDLHKLVAYWIQIDNPHLYQTATRGQIKGIYSRIAKSCKAILDISGDLETAKKATSICRNWLIEKKLNFTIETILRNIPKFVDMIKKNEILPPEIDTALWREYIELKQIKGQNIDKEKIISYLKEIISKGYNPNKILEKKIIELKRTKKDNISDIVIDIANKLSVNKEAQ